MALITLYHGSQKIIQNPEYGKGKIWNDYGRGFYCTESSELAKEWACPNLRNGFLNTYTLNTENLNILDLLENKYTTLHWLTLLITNRQFDLDTPILRRGVNFLKENFHINTDNYDIIKGYRADDSYFSFAKAFLSNQISYKQLQLAMKLGKLGEQIMLKSETAFSKINFERFEIVDSQIWNAKRKRREEKAKNDFYELLSEDSISGLFIRDFILQEVKNDDPRLQ